MMDKPDHAFSSCYMQYLLTGGAGMCRHVCTKMHWKMRGHEQFTTPDQFYPVGVSGVVS